MKRLAPICIALMFVATLAVAQNQDVDTAIWRTTQIEVPEQIAYSGATMSIHEHGSLVLINAREDGDNNRALWVVRGEKIERVMLDEEPLTGMSIDVLHEGETAVVNFQPDALKAERLLLVHDGKAERLAIPVKDPGAIETEEQAGITLVRIASVEGETLEHFYRVGNGELQPIRKPDGKVLHASQLILTRQANGVVAEAYEREAVNQYWLDGTELKPLPEAKVPVTLQEKKLVTKRFFMSTYTVSIARDAEAKKDYAWVTRGDQIDRIVGPFGTFMEARNIEGIVVGTDFYMLVTDDGPDGYAGENKALFKLKDTRVLKVGLPDQDPINTLWPEVIDGRLLIVNDLTREENRLWVVEDTMARRVEHPEGVPVIPPENLTVAAFDNSLVLTHVVDGFERYGVFSEGNFTPLTYDKDYTIPVGGPAFLPVGNDIALIWQTTKRDQTFWAIGSINKAYELTPFTTAKTEPMGGFPLGVARIPDGYYIATRIPTGTGTVFKVTR